MRRAIRFSIDQGITHFLDIGSGIPTFNNVHEIAQTAMPGARVVHVDNDVVAVGDVLTVKIIEVDLARRRIALSQTQARTTRQEGGHHS
jgi:ribosomal protein S1